MTEFLIVELQITVIVSENLRHGERSSLRFDLDFEDYRLSIGQFKLAVAQSIASILSGSHISSDTSTAVVETAKIDSWTALKQRLHLSSSEQVLWTKTLRRQQIPALNSLHGSNRGSDLKVDPSIQDNQCLDAAKSCVFARIHQSEDLQNFIRNGPENFTFVAGDCAEAFLNSDNWLDKEELNLCDLSQSMGNTICLHLLPSNLQPPPQIICRMSSAKSSTDLANNEFVTYTVTVSQGLLEWQVARRFSEFFSLVQSLKDQSQQETGYLHKSLIPSLPPKRLFSHSNKTVAGNPIVNERLEGLQIFLDKLLSIREMYSNVHVMAFLGLLSTARFEGIEQVTSRVSRNVIHISKLRTELQWGDIILFKCPSVLSGLQRKITGAEWDHVGLVVKSPFGQSLELLEATGEGVTCYPAIGRIRAYSCNSFTKYMAVRRFSGHRTAQMFQKMVDFVCKVDGKPYGFTLNKLFERNTMQTNRMTTDTKPDEDTIDCLSELTEEIRAQDALINKFASDKELRITDQVNSIFGSRQSGFDAGTVVSGDRTSAVTQSSAYSSSVPNSPNSESKSDGEALDNISYFCSELVAACLKDMMIIRADKISSSAFWPGSFATGHEVDNLLAGGIRYEEEMLIDCKIMEISKATVNPDAPEIRLSFVSQGKSSEPARSSINSPINDNSRLSRFGTTLMNININTKSSGEIQTRAVTELLKNTETCTIPEVESPTTTSPSNAMVPIDLVTSEDGDGRPMIDDCSVNKVACLLGSGSDGAMSSSVRPSLDRFGLQRKLSAMVGNK